MEYNGNITMVNRCSSYFPKGGIFLDRIKNNIAASKEAYKSNLVSFHSLSGTVTALVKYCQFGVSPVNHSDSNSGGLVVEHRTSGFDFYEHIHLLMSFKPIMHEDYPLSPPLITWLMNSLVSL